jgi:hypothetical protein
MTKAGLEYVRGPARSRSSNASFWTGRAGIAIAAVLFALVVGVWGLRFAGYFGGPVPVKTLTYWRARLAP